MRWLVETSLRGEAFGPAFPQCFAQNDTARGTINDLAMKLISK